MEVPELLAYLAMAVTEGKSREEVLEDIGRMARGEPVESKPQTEREWSIYHNQRQHDAYVAWLHSDD